mmetsp:Transcript_74261/g.172263  ORF Transcript_74261/g.172263 Transcript_74261/m.172263 type:complete len:237 (+) Transcript_74261:457-1167(+)
MPVHPVVFPLTLVGSAVIPHIQALAVESVCAEIAFVRAAGLVALVGDGALTAFYPSQVLTHEFGAIGEGQCPLAMLLSVHPLPLVHRAIRQCADALAMRHVVDPRAHVHTAVGILEGAKPIRLAPAELAPIGPTVRPDLVAFAVGLIAEPLPRVLNAIRERVLLAFLATPFRLHVALLPLLGAGFTGPRLQESHWCLHCLGLHVVLRRWCRGYPQGPAPSRLFFTMGRETAWAKEA